MPRLNRTQQAVARVIYILSGIIVLLIFISFVVRLFGGNELVVSTFFTGTFKGIYADANIGSAVLSLYLLVAMTYFPIFAYLIMLFVTSFLVLNPIRIFRGILNSIFRFIELFLVTRFLFKILAASVQSSFVSLIYQSTNFIPDTLSILPVIKLTNSELEVATFFIFGIILVIDILIWNLLTSLLDEQKYEQIK